MQEDGYNIIPLLGNHEDFMLSSFGDKGVYASWMYNGGYETLQSYGFVNDLNDDRPTYVKYVDFISQKHWDWLNSLKTIHVTDDYVFVHASLDFQKDDPINDTDRDTALWSRISRRKDKAISSAIGGRTLVTGHTVTDKQTMEEMANGEDLITIDRGCCFSGSDYEHLAVFNLDTKQFRFIKNIDNIERD